jgi:hypothetical protein
MGEVSEILKSVLGWAKDHRITVGAAVVMILINALVDTELVPHWLPRLYNGDMLENNRPWVLLFFSLAVVSLLVSWHWLGLTLTCAICIALAVFVGLYYGGNPNWLFVIWLAYRSCLALLVGPVVRAASKLD